jgi:uncharacterized membrane protein
MQDPVNDFKKYKHGVYYNPEDPRIIVPKKIRMLGVTLNFARWQAYLIVILIFLLAGVLSIMGYNSRL